MTRSVSLVTLAALLWSTTGTAAFYLAGSLSPFAIGAITFGAGGVVLAVLGGRQSLAVVRDKKTRSWALIGALGAVVYPVSFYSGMAQAGIAVGNVVALGLGPLVGALLEWMVDHRAPRKSWWVIAGFALTGVVLMSAGKVERVAGPLEQASSGIVWASIAGLAYGVYTFALGRIMRAGHTSRAAAGAVFGSAAPFLGALVALTVPMVMMPALHWSLLAYLVLGPMVLAYVSFSAALAKLSASSVATFALLEPVGAALLAILVVGERLSAQTWWGMLVVVCALLCLAGAVRVPRGSITA